MIEGGTGVLVSIPLAVSLAFFINYQTGRRSTFRSHRGERNGSGERDILGPYLDTFSKHSGAPHIFRLTIAQAVRQKVMD